MKGLLRLWAGLSALWIALVLTWGHFIQADDKGFVWIVAFFPPGLIGAILFIIAWAFAT